MTTRLLTIGLALLLGGCTQTICQNGVCQKYQGCFGPGNSGCVHCDEATVCGTFTIQK